MQRNHLFAVLALGLLLCLAPMGVAADALPEEAAVSSEAAEPEAPAEQPILPENPPTMISYITPEMYEDEVPETLEQVGSSTPAPAESSAGEAAAKNEVPDTLPQTGTSAGAGSILLGAGSALLTVGWFFTHRQAAARH